MVGLQEWCDATLSGALAVERGIAAVAIGSSAGVFLLFSDKMVMPTWVLVFLILGAMAAVGFTTWFTFQGLHYGRKALLSCQIFIGNRMVHEALNDLVVEDLNLVGLPLDHIVFSPAGVFLLETQRAMQCRSLFESAGAYRATYDGRSIVFQRRRINGPLDGVRKRAPSWLSGFLKRSERKSISNRSWLFPAGGLRGSARGWFG
jgi:hypothetical protein